MKNSHHFTRNGIFFQSGKHIFDIMISRKIVYLYRSLHKMHLILSYNRIPQHIDIIIFSEDSHDLISSLLVALSMLCFPSVNSYLRESLSVNIVTDVHQIVILCGHNHILCLVSSLGMSRHNQFLRLCDLFPLHHRLKVSKRPFLLNGGGLCHTHSVIRPFSVTGPPKDHVNTAAVFRAEGTGVCA